MDTRDELRELRATALIIADDAYGEPVAVLAATKHAGDCTGQPHTCLVCEADKYRELAEATMKADTAAGYALVPLEATDEMVNIGLVKHWPDIEPYPLPTNGDRMQNAINAAIATGNILRK